MIDSTIFLPVVDNNIVKCCLGTLAPVLDIKLRGTYSLTLQALEIPLKKFRTLHHTKGLLSSLLLLHCVPHISIQWHHSCPLTAASGEWFITQLGQTKILFNETTISQQRQFPLRTIERSEQRKVLRRKLTKQEKRPKYFSATMRWPFASWRALLHSRSVSRCVLEHIPWGDCGGKIIYVTILTGWNVPPPNYWHYPASFCPLRSSDTPMINLHGSHPKILFKKTMQIQMK